MNSEVVIDELIRELRSGAGPFSPSQLAVLELAARERKMREEDLVARRGMLSRVASQLKNQSDHA